MQKFKKGDKVKCIESSAGGTLMLGELYTVEGYTYHDSCNVNVYNKSNRLLTHWDENRFELVKKGKVVPENHERFMAYGTGCDNKSNLVKTEKELKEMLTKAAHDSAWSGDIIGYKLVPLYTAEKTVKLKAIKPVVVKKRK